MPIYALGDLVPDIHPSAFVHPDAVVIGDVVVGAESTLWPGSVLRGDQSQIRVGDQTSVQDGTVVHVSRGLPTVIGDRCVVGHLVHLEGCTIEDDCLIGSGSVVLHRAVVGSGSLVAAQAFVPTDTVIPPRSRAMGVPARIAEGVMAQGAFSEAVAIYVANSHRYRSSLRRLD